MRPGADQQPAFVVGDVPPRDLLEAGEVLAEVVLHHGLQRLRIALGGIEVAEAQHVGPPLAQQLVGVAAVVVVAGRPRLGNLDVVLAVPELLVLVLHARPRGPRASGAALSASFITRAIRSAGGQGRQVLRADERVRPRRRRCRRCSTAGPSGMPSRSLSMASISQSTAFFTPGQISSRNLRVRAQLVLAVRRLDAGAVAVDEGAVRRVLAVRLVSPLSCR